MLLQQNAGMIYSRVETRRPRHRCPVCHWTSTASITVCWRSTSTSGRRQARIADRLCRAVSCCSGTGEGLNKAGYFFLISFMAVLIIRPNRLSFLRLSTYDN